jgi:hypothetical protein
VNCPVCGDQGVLRVRYRDKSPDDFGVCLCAAGQALRVTKNARKDTDIPLWFLWAAQRGIPGARICRIEELLDRKELAAIPQGEAVDSVNAIADAMRTAPRPRL